MTKEKVLFRETKIYPVFFMILITVIFVGLLATFYELTIENVHKYRQNQLKKMIVGSFNLPEDNFLESYSNYISEHKRNGFVYYEAIKDGQNLGFCLPITGSGLWGSISGLISVDADFKKIINLEIIDQNETPGLGGRITEEWFKNQFSNLPIIENGAIANYKLIPENDKRNNNQVNQITGATSSSKAVVKMVEKNLEKYRTNLRDVYE